jgi:hypothetical protein
MFTGALGAEWSVLEHSKIIEKSLEASRALRRIPEGGCQAREEIAFF